MQSEQKITTFFALIFETTLGIIIRGRKNDRERERENLKGKRDN